MKGGDTWNMTISEETIVGNVILELMKKISYANTGKCGTG